VLVPAVGEDVVVGNGQDIEAFVVVVAHGVGHACAAVGLRCVHVHGGLVLAPACPVHAFVGADDDEACFVCEGRHEQRQAQREGDGDCGKFFHGWFSSFGFNYEQ
jgi:hypothetical protein